MPSFFFSIIYLFSYIIRRLPPRQLVDDLHSCPCPSRQCQVDSEMEGDLGFGSGGLGLLVTASLEVLRVARRLAKTGEIHSSLSG